MAASPADPGSGALLALALQPFMSVSPAAVAVPDSENTQPLIVPANTPLPPVLADMVKQHRPKLKVLYTTGGSGVDQLRAEAGILHGDILKKPFTPDELKLELRRLLE